MDPEQISKIRYEAAKLWERYQDIKNDLHFAYLAADRVGKSWCKSNHGYHACVYYERFQEPPGEAFFHAVGTGISSPYTNGQWRVYEWIEVFSEIFDDDQLLTNSVRELSRDTLNRFASLKADLMDQIERSFSNDPYLETQSRKLAAINTVSIDTLNLLKLPNHPGSTDDPKASFQGITIALHDRVKSYIESLENDLELIDQIRRIADNVLVYWQQKLPQTASVEKPMGKHVFIGHGRSPHWMQLRDLITKLGLQFEEFNRVSPAGFSNTEKLQLMLENSAIAFLIMTAEDEMADGDFQARMNVVHEAGLFQGRLGFKKAIILLEDGCKEFSNIHGLGHVSYPKGHIKATFEEVREILAREGLITS